MLTKQSRKVVFDCCQGGVDAREKPKQPGALLVLTTSRNSQFSGEAGKYGTAICKLHGKFHSVRRKTRI
jgi:hypothetical protein